MLPFLAEIAQTSGLGGTEALLIGALVALGNGLVETVKALVMVSKRRNDKVVADSCVQCRSQIHEVHAVVNRTDANGTPLVYGHRELLNRLDVAITEMNELCRSTDRLTDKISHSDKAHGRQGGLP